MQFTKENGKRDSLENPIVIHAPDAISSFIMELGYIDRLIDYC